eukprot:CAMPEP_0170503654 /NCGR_PEP_ID=MMETSP0208-20121228/45491_1 /TAXON_ID=197538 /ORGANISM="Strombidium inclinatum, Strain S3" /LENGTH=60 /DNA_ID=CAMNT_0010783413 /DNA_START=16 /DNA_END=194 /DNA_ORIENTATION=+
MDWMSSEELESYPIPSLSESVSLDLALAAFFISPAEPSDAFFTAAIPFDPERGLPLAAST